MGTAAGLATVVVLLTGTAGAAGDHAAPEASRDRPAAEVSMLSTTPRVPLRPCADDETWLSHLRTARTDFPLLFDTQHRPKKALERIMAF